MLKNIILVVSSPSVPDPQINPNLHFNIADSGWIIFGVASLTTLIVQNLKFMMEKQSKTTLNTELIAFRDLTNKLIGKIESLESKVTILDYELKNYKEKHPLQQQINDGKIESMYNQIQSNSSLVSEIADKFEKIDRFLSRQYPQEYK